MKKFILPIILLLIVVFFPFSKVDAQTSEECAKTRARSSYNCLIGWDRCFYPCVDQTKDVKACGDTCTQAEDACNKQVDADYGTCLAPIPKDKEDTSVPKSPSPPKVDTQPEPECRKIFDSAMSQCMKDYNACSDACSGKTKKPDGTTYFNSGEIYQKCMKASDCSGKSSACNEQALANFRACGKSDEQPKTAEVKKGTPIQDGIRFFGEWTSQVINDWTIESDIIDCRPVPVKGCLRFGVPPQIPVEFKTITGKNLEETLNWQPIITKEVEQKAWREFLPIYTPGKENIAVVSGQGEIKPPNSDQFEFITVINTSAASDMVTVTFFDSTVKSTSDAIQLRYAWSPDSGAVINVPNWSEIKFREPVEVGGPTSRRVELGQGEIEVKIRNNKPAENQFGVDAGWLGVTASRTHFWVSQSEDKKVAVIGVYEGEVEIKAKDGKTTKVKPDGDPSTGSGQGKPGIVIVSQKLSPVKLSILGLVIAGTIGGIIWLIKKISSQKHIKKR